MHWCLDYKNYLKTKEKVKENIDEVIIKDIYKYKNTLNELKNILDLLAEEHKRILIILYDNLDPLILDFLKSYNEGYPIYIILSFTGAEEDIYPLKFFYDAIVNTKEFYNDTIKTEVTDIYVGDELGFSMEYMRKPHEKNIRVIPCQAQTSGLFPKLNSFFIRPEDIKLYEDFIDVMDLSFVTNAATIADIYISKKKWIGDLSQIIFGLPEGFHGDGIIPDFGYRRLNCEKRCQNKGNQCHICERYAKLSQNAKKNGIYFKA